MKTRVKRLLIVCLSLSVILAGCDTDSTIDPPDESYFVKFYGGEGNQTGVDAVLNTDGTVTLFGTTESLASGRQLYLVNIEPNGRVVWEQTYGGPEDDIAKDILLTNDGRLVVLADYGNASRDILLMTLTTDGNKIDSTLTGLLDNLGVATDEIAVSITQTTDGFLVSGSTDNLDLKPEAPGTNEIRDALHLRYFNDLTIYPNTWRQAHGPGDFDEGAIVIPIPQSQIVDETEYYFFGYSNRQSTDFNPFILGLGVDGETTRDYNFLPGNPGTDEIINSVTLSPVQSGEGYMLAGISSTTNTSDIFIAKLRKTLSFQPTDFQFQKNLAVDLGILINNRTSIFASAGSGFYILTNENIGTAQNFYLNKIGNDGNLLWNSPVIFGGELDDHIGSVLEFPDGSLGIIGTFAIGQDGETKMAFIKVNREGKFSK